MSRPTSAFEITRRDPSLNISGKYDAEAPRGFPLGAHATDPESFALAQHNNFLGHLTRRVVEGGLSITDRLLGVTSAEPVGFESPFTKGLEVSLTKAHEIECEDAYILRSGTGAITEETTVPNACSFKDSLLRLTQEGEIPNYMLTAVGLEATEAGKLRCRFEKI